MKTMIRIATVCLLLMVCTSVNAQGSLLRKVLPKTVKVPKVPSVRPTYPRVPVVPPNPQAYTLPENKSLGQAILVPPHLPDSTQMSLYNQRNPATRYGLRAKELHPSLINDSLLWDSTTVFTRNSIMPPKRTIQAK